VGLGAALIASPLTAIAARAAAPACVPAVEVEAVSAGLSRISISAPCLASQKLHLKYDALDFVRALDESGKASLVFDCFLGDKVPLTISFADGTFLPVHLRTLDLDRVTKIAVTWNGNVRLDLHAFEYAAALSDEAHIWRGAPSSRWQAEERRRQDGRGHGFLSFISRIEDEGSQLQVYTFVHEAHQVPGAITLALDYESRARSPRDPDTCGTGLYAELEYKVAVWRPDGRVSRSRGVFAAQECNQPAGDAIARYSAKALPQILLR
jgi:hypothetical protein